MIDTSDMLAVHAAFRDTLAQSGALVSGVAPGDLPRAAAVASYYDNVLRFLAVHHEGEDELLWPTLLERLPDDAVLIETVAAQHHEVHDLTEGAQQAVAAWAASPDDATAATAVAALGAVRDALVPHLDQEEREILPLASEVFSAEEWAQFPAHGTAHFTGDKLWLVLGLIRDHMTEEQRALMLEGMPPPAVEFWTGTGEGLYRGFLAELGV